MSVAIESPIQTDIAGRLLLGPGPSMVHPRVYRALARPLFGHLDPEFLAGMEAAQQAAANVYNA